MIKKFPDYAQPQNFLPEVVISILVIHLLALLALFTFTWAGFYSFWVLYAVSALGITFCFHRMLSHCSFKAKPVLRYLAAFLGCLSLQGGPIRWVATHRCHHANADKPEDPHTPVVYGFLWAHLLWMFFRHPKLTHAEDIHRLTLDLQKDPVLVFLERHFIIINVLFGFMLFIFGYLLGGVETGISVLVWGGFLRIVFVWHMTWLINSATHIWGYRNYETPDNSRNLWWLSVISMGEGWHNNHHRFQRPAKTGHRWFELDPTYLLILFLEQCGWIYDVVPLSGPTTKHLSQGPSPAVVI